MAIVSKKETLTFTFKITRELHDLVDEVRKKAKGLGVSYDPNEALEKALRKDVSSSLKKLEVLQELANQRK
ncbi:hypothetical protein [Janthinobacterium sp. MDT1-19]|uniref:hypothetical protein n=1 Tax=Janthinobacterium sp. MDT1-19 TaxID=1259339 RepID=UPI003F279EFD